MTMPQDAITTPVRIGLLLTPGFALMGYAALIEAFRGANALSGARLYEWSHISRDGLAVEASNGARIMADSKVGERVDCTLLFVFAGGDPRGFDDPATLAWLRLMTRGGCRVAGVSGGAYVLARAGLLAGRRATIHWEYRPALREDFPDIAIESGLYVIDGPIITCAGGGAAMDLALALIGQSHGEDLARRVAEWFVQSTPRAGHGAQRLSLAERYGTTNGPLLKALQLLEDHLDQALPRAAVVRASGVSLRHLERLFVRHLGQSLSETAMAIRLQAAADRLLTTDMSVTDIAIDCGFSGAAHFSRRFRARFGMAPSAMRGRRSSLGGPPK
jgi:transcriptional regulator GlxA family with amidase domain